jgi:long-chain acyl-CoA synthetase
MGAHIAGCVVTGVYPTYQPVQLRQMLVDCDAKVLVVENEEQLDKYLAVRADLPAIVKVYVIDWTGLRNFDDPIVQPIEQLYVLGKKFQEDHPADLDAAINGGANGDTVVLTYTSGTSGPPKGAEISNRFLLFMMTASPNPFRIGPDDDILTHLPLCHIAERIVSLCMCLGHGTRLNFAESAETVLQNLQELAPSVVFTVPRLWEKFYSRISTLMSDASWFGRIGYRWAMRIGHKRAERILAGKRIPAGLDLQYRIADRLVLRHLKELIGISRAKYLLSGAAPISADLLKWYLAMGLSVSEAYGQTETGLIMMTHPERPVPGSVGFPLPDVEIRLGENEEVLVRSPGLFSGYRNNKEATDQTLVGGWVHTGDVGEILADGSYRIKDRLKDIIITAGGKNVAPNEIENTLKFSPYIVDATIIGDRRKYLTALIMIDQENVEHYAQTRSIPFTDYKSLCARPEIVELIGSEVEKVNMNYSPVEQVKKFKLIDKLLTAEDDEMTPTMKLKRKIVEKKYSELIEAMY